MTLYGVCYYWVFGGWMQLDWNGFDFMILKDEDKLSTKKKTLAQEQNSDDVWPNTTTYTHYLW